MSIIRLFISLSLVLISFSFIGGSAVMAQDTQTHQRNADIKKAVFAGGCFWCMQPPFDKTQGIIATRVGYTGGTVMNPTYQRVSAGGTGHYEAIEVTYDASIITYDKLLDIFWRNIDPLDPYGQFCDKGDSYKSAIFFMDKEEEVAARTSKKEIEQSAHLPGQIVTAIAQAETFWPAEDYHQDYYKKNPIRYKYYRYRCGRDARLEQLWGAK